VEQYDGEVSLRQGPWTDVYALCAVLYTAITGRAPSSSVGRIVRDEQITARQAGKGRYSESFLSAIDAGLSVRPEQRPQNMAALRALMDMPVPAPDPAPSPALAAAQAQVQAAARAERRAPWFLIGGAALVAALGLGAWLIRR
jgi:hypothetical protein